MKKNFTLLLLLTLSYSFSQIPTGYYDTATGSGYTLKTQLYNIITNHNDQGYDAFDAFTATNDLDLYYENDNSTILDIYSENPTGIDPYNYTPVIDECGNYNGEGVCYNKEHVIPQSIFNQNAPMRGDAHHLLPTDGRVNGFRSNHPFGYVGANLVSQSGITNPTRNGSKLGNNINTGLFSGYSNTVFEPIDEFKGDIARIYFYFITRYETQVTNWNYDMFNGTSDQVLTDTFLYTLLDWHFNDPVSQKEIDRNNAIYTYQNNRNPFIDHPEYVCQIYNSQCATLNTPDFTSVENITVYPNPTINEFYISTAATLKSIIIYNVNGQIIQKIEQPNTISNETYQVSNLSSGFYLVEIASDNGKIIKKIIVN
ncbi:hypothetical protein SY27_02765 [Flavobacterium sp. 316]|uniref:endonuclease n=1 Tax=Flavobacterium sp. 316 TaxID=1603293 RepID=UPI0005E52F92|nr:endonuclease [Flavobacterium sp. 316]KIX22755.1 hypothetical protein SY27_02765 [Flavobacterium sp. 316]